MVEAIGGSDGGANAHPPPNDDIPAAFLSRTSAWRGASCRPNNASAEDMWPPERKARNYRMRLPLNGGRRAAVQLRNSGRVRASMARFSEQSASAVRH